MTALKKILKPIYRSWRVQLPIQAVQRCYRRIYLATHKRRFSELKQFKDCHRGKRCFVIATGPSLTLEDLNLLKGEICFGMNSIYKFFSHTDWRPDYYAICDETMYQKVKDEIDKIHLKCVFSPDTSAWNCATMHKLPCIPSSIALTDEERRHYKKWMIKHMSDDISEIVYTGTSVVYVILQICFYMGFDEIYLLGADCSNFGHHSQIARYKDEDKISGCEGDTVLGIMADYQMIKEAGDAKGIKVYNATRGGKLELFPRVNLDNVLSNR